MRMDEVKSQISLVKGERNKCQEVTSALYSMLQPRLLFICQFFLDEPTPSDGYMARQQAGLWLATCQPWTVLPGNQPPDRQQTHPHPRGAATPRRPRQSLRLRRLIVRGCWSFRLLTYE